MNNIDTVDLPKDNDINNKVIPVENLPVNDLKEKDKKIKSILS
jgi:hypothetical protein